jgi:hypothetical protein
MKYDEVATVIERRVRRGDYILTGIPGERELAAEQGVSPMTARKAVQQLVDRKVLIRKPNGRLQMNTTTGHESHKRELQIALLLPAYESSLTARWHRIVASLNVDVPYRIRPVTCVHWEDPVIANAVNSFDGVLLVAPAEPLPAFVGDILRAASATIVSLESNLSHLGIISLDSFPVTSIHRLLRHLYDLGHRTIDCLSTQPADQVCLDRISQWTLWRELHGVGGALHLNPVRSYEPPLPKAYQVMSDLLDSGQFDATAVLCITEPAAVGCLRAIREHGLVAGRDLSVCMVNDEGIARYHTPTITALEQVDPVPYLSMCIRHMANGGEWAGPLVIRPEEVPLFVGESTGPAPESTARAS